MTISTAPRPAYVDILCMGENGYGHLLIARARRARPDVEPHRFFLCGVCS